MDFLPVIIIILAAFLLFKILRKPIKLLFKLLLNAAVGFLVLFLVNIFGLNIDMNLLNALIIGILGLPGVIILIIVSLV